MAWIHLLRQRPGRASGHFPQHSSDLSSLLENRSECFAIGSYESAVRTYTSELEDHPGRNRSGENVGDRFVDLVELAIDGDDLGASRGVQLEDIVKVIACSDDRADDGLAVQNGVEDRQVQRRVVGR